MKMTSSSSHDFLLPTDTRLNNVSREISAEEIGSEFLNSLCLKMESIAMDERDAEHPDLPSLVGLAGPQVGEFVRIILFDMQADDSKTNPNPDIRFVVNPRIITASNERELGREGCYSTADIRAVVNRHRSLIVAGLDKVGKPILYELEGFQARIVQHEIDHLDGIRCPDRIDSLSHLHQVSDSEFQDYRENWATWDKFYEIEDWLKIKSGGSV